MGEIEKNLIMSSSCSLQKIITRTTTALIGSSITFFLIRNDVTAGHFMSGACGITAYEYYHVISVGLQNIDDVAEDEKHILKNENYYNEKEKYKYHVEPISIRRKRGPSRLLLTYLSIALTYFAHHGNSQFYLAGLFTISSIVTLWHFVFRWNRGNAPPTTLDMYDLYIDLNGIFIIWMLGHIILLRYFPTFGTAYIAIVLIVAWTADTGALIFGALCGKYTPKLMPVISPNKTWAGFIGAIVAGIGIMLFLGVLMQYDSFFDVDSSIIPSRDGSAIDNSCWVALIFIGFILGLASVLGDAIESAIKRAARVKDSGSKLPGHGGFFDRLDSVATCAIVMYHLIIPYFIPYLEGGSRQ